MDDNSTVRGIMKRSVMTQEMSSYSISQAIPKCYEFGDVRRYMLTILLRKYMLAIRFQ